MVTERPLLAILDYGIGNLHSAHKAFEHVGADARLPADKGLIADAAGVVLPGVGAFGPCMDALVATKLDEVAMTAIESGRPFMGICIGMQVLFEGSEEAPGRVGLGVFAGEIQRIPGQVKRPQMQWNVLDRKVDHPMFDGLPIEAWVYFVHSFAAPRSSDVIATCAYGADLTAAVARDIRRNPFEVQRVPQFTAQHMENPSALLVSAHIKKDRKSTRLNSSHTDISRMPSSA